MYSASHNLVLHLSFYYDYFLSLTTLRLELWNSSIYTTEFHSPLVQSFCLKVLSFIVYIIVYILFSAMNVFYPSYRVECPPDPIVEFFACFFNINIIPSSVFEFAVSSCFAQEALGKITSQGL